MIGTKWYVFTGRIEADLGFPLIPALACLPSSVFNVPHQLDLGWALASYLLGTSAIDLNPEGLSDCGVSFASPWSFVLFYQYRRCQFLIPSGGSCSLGRDDNHMG